MKRAFLIYIGSVLYLFVVASFVQAENMFDMMDKMDKRNFGEYIDKARDCAYDHNFSCSEEYLGKAKKLAYDKKDRARLSSAKDFLTKQKDRAADSRQQQKQNWSVKWYGDWGWNNIRNVSIRCGDGSDAFVYQHMDNKYQPFWIGSPVIKGFTSLDEAARNACR